MFHTTFALAKQADACVESYHKMAKTLGGIIKYGRDTPIPLDKVLDALGLADALWSLRCTLEPCEREARLLACTYTEHVLQIFEAKYPADNRPRHCIEVARRYTDGLATEQELQAAWGDARETRSFAWAAARDATVDAAWAAAWAAAWRGCYLGC